MKLPPLSVHVVWSAESEGGLAPEVGKALFEFLNFKLVDHGNRIEPGAGIPVHVGTHLDLAADWVDQCYPTVPDTEDGSAVAEGWTDDEAEYRPCIVLVPILDRAARIDEKFDDQVLEWLRFVDKHQPGCNANLLLLPVPLVRSWLSRIPSSIPPCRSAVWLDDKAAQLEAVVDEVGLEICHFLMDRASWRQPAQSRKRVRIFISHAKADLQDTGNLAINIRNHLATTGLKSFFDLNDVARGRDLETQLRDGQRESIFLSIHTDNYAESPYCLEEILVAKKYGVPLVNLVALKERQERSPAYGGNTQVIVYQPEEDAAVFYRQITLKCMEGWLKHLHFHHAAGYSADEEKFPVKPDIISRPPELIDFAHGLLPMRGAGFVLHPDPPLPQSEAALLKKTNPKLRLLSPTTAYGNTFGRNPAPLFDGYRVGLSLSNSPDLPGLDKPDPDKAGEGGKPNHAKAGSQLGLVGAHYKELANHLTISLVRNGASLGYGGHLQKMGYTHLLSKTIGDYKRTTKSSQDLLYSYVARYLWEICSEDDTDDIDAKYFRCGDDLEGSLPAPQLQAIQLSQMRMKMAEDCFFRIILGGKANMKHPDDYPKGYSGVFPGQAEEAWYQLESNQALYVLGAFGGAARQVADAIQGKRIPAPATEDSDYYRNLLEGYKNYWSTLPDPPSHPDSLKSMWADFKKAGYGYFHGKGKGEDKVWHNGLTVAENRILFESFNSAQIVELVLRGMKRTIEATRKGDRINDLVLFNGSIVDTPEVDAYAVTVMEDAPLRGADGALDESLDGALANYLQTRPDSDRDADGLSIFSTRDSGLAGDWVLLYETAGFSSTDGDGAKESSAAWRKQFDLKLRKTLSKTFEKANASGITSLAIVLFGANMGAGYEQSAEAILHAINQCESLANLQTVVLCEHDHDRYDYLRNYLRITDDSDIAHSRTYQEKIAGPARSKHELRVSELPPSPPVNHNRKIPAIYLDVRKQGGDKIVCYAQSAGAGTAVSLQDAKVDWGAIMEMVHANDGLPPALDEQDELGIRLAQLVLPDSVAATIRRNPTLPIDVFHDVGSAALPFELFRFQPDDGNPFSPSREGGMRRCLLAKDLSTRQQAYKKSFPLKLLLVTNPTGDLDAAITEGERILELLEELRKFADIEVTHLSNETRPKATRANVLKELAKGHTIFHYAGHARYDLDDPAKRGLEFPRNQFLTAAHLEERNIHKNPPAVAVINACESARVRSAAPDREHAAGVSFAEWFLRCGMHAYIGNIWEVEDESAEIFATEFYTDILEGRSLGDAVLRSRKALANELKEDWCNYVLYGDADLRV